MAKLLEKIIQTQIPSSLIVPTDLTLSKEVKTQLKLILTFFAFFFLGEYALSQIFNYFLQDLPDKATVMMGGHMDTYLCTWASIF